MSDSGRETIEEFRQRYHHMVETAVLRVLDLEAALQEVLDVGTSGAADKAILFGHSIGEEQCDCEACNRARHRQEVADKASAVLAAKISL